MGSIEIKLIMEKYPGKSEVEVAAEYARESGLVVIVKYKNSSDGDFVNFGGCSTYDKVKGYFDSPYCFDTEIVYDSKNDPKGCREINCPNCGSSITIQPDIIGVQCGICSASIQLKPETVEIIGYEDILDETKNMWEYGAIQMSNNNFHAAKRNIKTGEIYGKVSALGGWTSVHATIAGTFFKTDVSYPALKSVRDDLILILKIPKVLPIDELQKEAKRRVNSFLKMANCEFPHLNLICESKSIPIEKDPPHSLVIKISFLHDFTDDEFKVKSQVIGKKLQSIWDELKY